MQRMKRTMENAEHGIKRSETHDRMVHLGRAIQQRPDAMTIQLAREFDVPEAEVLRAFPPERATPLDAARWEELIRRLELLGSVRVIVSNGATTMEAVGRFGGFSTTGDYYNVQTESLDLHLRWAEIYSIFAVRKPGHVVGQMTHSIQFFDRAGNSAFKVFLNFGKQITSERLQVFEQIQEEFRAIYE